MSELEKSLLFEIKLAQCSNKVSLEPSNGSPPFTLFSYQFWKLSFDSNDLQTQSGLSLSQQYMDRLLIPLFQTNPLYANINQISGSPRFTKKVCNTDFLNKIVGIKPNTISILLSDPESRIKPVGKLVGDISCFDTNSNTLFNESLKPGSPGALKNDLIKLFNNFPEDFNTQKCAYFNGIGIASEYQGQGLGVYLLYSAIKELNNKGFKTLITRVMTQAKNYSLMTRLENKKVMSYSNPDLGKDYRVVLTSPITIILEQLKEELKTKFINYQDLI